LGPLSATQPKTLASDVESVSARPQEALNEKAVTVMNRISNKLTGKDFGAQPIDVPTQVQRLIDEATSAENLCQCYIGWCPFW
jgi:FKBP12-rapamycin complex-associated protein